MNRLLLLLLSILSLTSQSNAMEWPSSKPNIGVQFIGAALAVGGVYTLVAEEPEAKKSSSLVKLCKGGTLIGLGALLATGNTKNAYQSCSKKASEFYKHNHIDHVISEIIMYFTPDPW